MRLKLKDLQERVIERPFYVHWDYDTPQSIKEEGKINYDGLTDAEKMYLYVYAWNLSERCPFRRSIMKQFGWTSYKVQKLFRELKEFGMESVPTFNEHDLMLNGRGYMINATKISNH
jgi:hypothetical protein